MIEISIDNLAFLNKDLMSIENISYKLNKGTILEVPGATFNPSVRTLMNTYTLLEQAITLDDSEPGTFILRNDTYEYIVLFGPHGIITEELYSNNELIAESSIKYTDGYPIYTGTYKESSNLSHIFYLRPCYDLINSFIFVNDSTGYGYFQNRFKVRDRFIENNLNFTEILNKYYKILGFDVEVFDNGDVKTHGVTINYCNEGSGFLSLLNILPEIEYCKKTEKTLVIPNYTRHLHPIVIKGLKSIIEESGISAIMTKEEEY